MILVPQNAAADLALVAAQIAVGKHLDSEGVVFRRAAKVAVKSEPGMWFNVDGELLGNEPARVRNHAARAAVFGRAPQT